MPEPFTRTRIDQLGVLLDSWGDLIDNMGHRADDLAQFVRDRLARREMPRPQVVQDDRLLTAGGFMAHEQRRYHLAIHQAGATMALYVGAFGRDLYVAWDLYINQVWKRRNLAIILAVSVLLGLPSSIGLAILVQDEIGVCIGAVAWLLSTIMNLVFVSAVVGLAGLLLKRSFWAFFREEYDRFRVDDVAAMSLAVHHSVLEGLDYIGVDRQSIRAKDQFRAGQRGRIL